MNKKGEISISLLVIACLMFIVFLTAGLGMVTDFFSYDQNSDGSSYDETYYTSLEKNSMEGNGTAVSQFVGTATGMSNDVFETNGTVGEDSPEDLMNRQTLTSLRRLPNIYTFVKSVGRDASEKLHIPAYFLYALVTIVIIIIVFGTMKALRGIK